MSDIISEKRAIERLIDREEGRKRWKSPSLLQKNFIIPDLTYAECLDLGLDTSLATVESNFTNKKVIARDPNNESGFVGLGAAIANAVGQVTTALPQLGVGRRSRVKEAKSLSDIKINEAGQLENIESESEQDKTRAQQKIVLIAGTMLLVIVAIIIAFRN